METGQSSLRINTYPVLQEAIKRTAEPEDVRKALMEAVRAVPEEELRNFRAGQILVVM